MEYNDAIGILYSSLRIRDFQMFYFQGDFFLIKIFDRCKLKIRSPGAKLAAVVLI